MKKGPVEVGANEKEGQSESKVTNQIFARLQHPKNVVRYLQNILFRFPKRFFTHKWVFFTKVIKANIIAPTMKFLRPVLSVKNTPFTFFEF